MLFDKTWSLNLIYNVFFYLKIEIIIVKYWKVYYSSFIFRHFLFVFVLIRFNHQTPHLKSFPLLFSEWKNWKLADLFKNKRVKTWKNILYEPRYFWIQNINLFSIWPSHPHIYLSLIWSHPKSPSLHLYKTFHLKSL